MAQKQSLDTALKKKPLPFLKWAGGKRWLAPKILPLLRSGNRFIEPFLGSGAAFFFAAPQSSILADVNTDLVATFRAVRDVPDLLLKHLAALRINAKTFHAMRRWCPTTDLDRAVRLIYLNRTAFNGLYRVNRQGEFNVPFGCKKGTSLCDYVAIRGASRALAKAQILQQDFRITVGQCKPGDVVYADPPYTVKHDNNGFSRYNEKIFSWDDQRQLAEALVKLAKRHVRIIVSNAHHENIRKMYPKTLFRAFLMTRSTCMAGDATRRGTCNEFLIVSTNFGKDLMHVESTHVR